MISGKRKTIGIFLCKAYSLFDERQIAAGTVYIALSVVLCIAGILVGKRIAMLNR